MDEIEGVAAFMQREKLTLVTAESCTAGLIAAMLADVPGAGQLLDCAFVVYSPQAKQRLLGVSRATMAANNLTSEPVAIEMALGAASNSPATIAVSNTGVTDDTDDGIPAGTQCFAWVFRNNPDGRPRIYAETVRFSGDRLAIRKQSARHALLSIMHYHQPSQP